MGLAWKLVAAVVTTASVAWVLFLFAQAWPGLAARLHEIRLPFLLLGALLATGSAYLTFEAFATLVGVVGIAGLPRRQLAHLHFTGQLLKHLPGRIWGVGYQWAAAGSAGSLSVWLLANIGHMLLATYFALWSAAVVLAAMRGLGWGLVALLAGAAVYFLGWLLPAFSALRRAAGRLPGRFGSLAKAGLEVLAATPVSARLRIFLLFLAAWMLLYSAWICYGLAYPALGAAGGVRMCAYYMIAWFAGYISVLAPSGLGIRELVFAWIAHGYGSDVIALMAILGRISLLAIDILLGLLFAPFAPRRV